MLTLWIPHFNPPNILFLGIKVSKISLKWRTARLRHLSFTDKEKNPKSTFYTWAPKPVCRHLKKSPIFKGRFCKSTARFFICIFLSRLIRVFGQAQTFIPEYPLENGHLFFMHLQFVCVWLQSSQHLVTCPSAQGESNRDSTCSWDKAGHQEDVYQRTYVMQTICDIHSVWFFHLLKCFDPVVDCEEICTVLRWETILTDADMAGQTT